MLLTKFPLWLPGLPALWRLVLDSDEAQVVAGGQQYLVSLYTSLSEQLQRDAKGVRTLFLQYAISPPSILLSLTSPCSTRQSLC